MEARLSDLIIRLAGGISQRRMYFDAHPRVAATSREVAGDLASLLRDMQAVSLTVGVYGGRFVRHGRYLVGPSIAGRSLVDFAERLQCGGFTFSLPLTADDLTGFFRLAADRSRRWDSLADARAAFAAAGLGHIALEAPLVEEIDDAAADDDEAGAAAGDFARLVPAYQSMYDAVAGNALLVGSNGAVDVAGAVDAGASLVALAGQGALDVMQFLRYPDYDSYTIGHSVRVAALSTMVARALGWPEDVLCEVAAAGLLHDIGKGRLPSEILFKPGRLDDDERRVIETHPELGVRLLLDNGEDSAVIMSAAWGHHLRHDGGGYPHSRSDHRPGIVAELLHVCDVFEALTARRPYKTSLSPRRAFEFMLRDAASFHPQLLATLVGTVGLYPPGSEVLLGDGRRAVVVAVGADLDRPRLRITAGPHGRAIPRDQQPDLDLAAHPSLEVAELLEADLVPAAG